MASIETNYSYSKLFHPDKETVEEFIQRFKLQNSVALRAATDEEGQLTGAILLANALPLDIITNIQRRLKPILLTAATYEQIEQHLLQSYSVKKSIINSAVSFVTRKQNPNESIESYSKTLNELASQCGYKDCCRDRMLRDIFVGGLRSPRLISTLLAECEDKSFYECVTRAKILE